MFKPIHEAVLNEYGAVGGAFDDVLDVGCGTGRLLESAAQRWSGARLTGIDPSEAMVAEARRKHEGDARFTFTVAGASDLPLEPSSFDTAFSTMSFHHWGDQASGIREVARVLRPGGLFVLADIDVPLLFLLHPLLTLGGHANFQGPRGIRRLLEQAGLSIVMSRRFWRLSRVQLVVARRDRGSDSGEPHRQAERG
jgi:ubiquinone/menaquinone biosynthesis C-methylase UbiE